MGSGSSPNPDLRGICAFLTVVDFCSERRDLHHTSARKNECDASPRKRQWALCRPYGDRWGSNLPARSLKSTNTTLNKTVAANDGRWPSGSARWQARTIIERQPEKATVDLAFDMTPQSSRPSHRDATAQVHGHGLLTKRDPVLDPYGSGGGASLTRREGGVVTLRHSRKVEFALLFIEFRGALGSPSARSGEGKSKP